MKAGIQYPFNFETVPVLPGKTGTVSKLIIGKYELHNLKAAIAPASVRSKQKNADAIIGNNSLRQFNLIFDYKHKKLYLKPNSFYNNVN